MHFAYPYKFHQLHGVIRRQHIVSQQLSGAAWRQKLFSDDAAHHFTAQAHARGVSTASTWRSGGFFMSCINYSGKRMSISRAYTVQVTGVRNIFIAHVRKPDL